MLAAVNSYLKYIKRSECCVRSCRVQRQMFRSDSLELSREEYQLLVNTALRQGKYRLSCIMQTIGATGIRIGELKYITVESLETGMFRYVLRARKELYF